jgi:acid phosphatase family membrane protein YuiD
MKLIIYIALTALATCVLSQTLKLLFNTMVNKTKFSLSKITSDGNYPSSHTGFVTSVTAISWIYTVREILNSENASISVWCSMAFTALAVVIIRDALGVRYTVQKLCETVTKLAEGSENAEEIRKELDIKSGHQPFEVVGGAILGIIVAGFTSCIYYKLYKLLPIAIVAFVLFILVSIMVLKKKRKENTA